MSELTHTVLVKLDTQGEIVYIDPQDMKSSGICLLVNGGFPPNRIFQRHPSGSKGLSLTKITSQIFKNLAEGSSASTRILNGNPPDNLQWKPSLKAHLATFKEPPQQASADRGLYSEPNETLAHDLGVQRVILPKPGYRSESRLKHEHKPWFVKGRKWHAGVECRISVLKRAHGLGRCLAHGLQGFQAWVGWGVIAGNLAVMGRT